jgi:hypothetical protein
MPRYVEHKTEGHPHLVAKGTRLRVRPVPMISCRLEDTQPVTLRMAHSCVCGNLPRGTGSCMAGRDQDNIHSIT